MLTELRAIEHHALVMGQTQRLQIAPSPGRTFLGFHEHVRYGFVLFLEPFPPLPSDDAPLPSLPPLPTLLVRSRGQAPRPHR